MTDRYRPGAPHPLSQRHLTVTAAVALAVVWLVLLAVSPVRSAVRRLATTVGREVRYLVEWPAERQAARHRRGPEVEVPDAVVADRVRAALVPLERRWGLDGLHVDVEDRVVVVHGEAPSARAARVVDRRVLRVPGVGGVESYLHVGPVHDGAQPSSGMRCPEPSEARRRLVAAAYAAGAPAERTLPIVRAVLGSLADRLPPAELDELLRQLPHDVSALCQGPARNGRHRRHGHSAAELMADLAPVAGPLDPAGTLRVMEAVLGTLRGLVPEAAGDVAEVLPGDLQALWLTSRARELGATAWGGSNDGRRTD